MLGAIVGDIVGSIYEGEPMKTKDFPLFSPHCCFTDDTVLTLAIAEALLGQKDYGRSLKDYYALYPQAGYGKQFRAWATQPDSQPYYSWGNGSAMRVSPIAYAYDQLPLVLQEAQRSAEVTHNHPEGIKGAQAVASAVFLARTGHSKSDIRQYLQTNFSYNLDRTLEQIRPTHQFDVSCQGTVPEATIAFLESTSFEDAIRNAVSLGGDTDTLACITGSIAHAFYQEIPLAISEQAATYLSDHLLTVLHHFETHVQLPGNSSISSS